MRRQGARRIGVLLAGYVHGGRDGCDHSSLDHLHFGSMRCRDCGAMITLGGPRRTMERPPEPESNGGWDRRGQEPDALELVTPPRRRRGDRSI